MTLSPGPVALAAIFIWGIATHVVLYGWQSAPVGSVRLTTRQWLIYLAIVLPLVVTIGAIVIFGQAVLDRFGSENVQSVLIGSILGLVASIWGLSPSMRHLR